MRLWTIISKLAVKLKNKPCQQATMLTDEDIGFSVKHYIKLKNQSLPDSPKHFSNKHSPHNVD